MRRQVELQKEMDMKKREADEKRQAEKRASHSHRPRSRKPSAEPVEPPQGLNFRSDSPPIPTMRSNPKGGPENHGKENVKEDVEPRADLSKQISRSGSPQVVDQLQTMRQGLERRQESLKGEDDFGAGGWDGLAEL